MSTNGLKMEDSLLTPYVSDVKNDGTYTLNLTNGQTLELWDKIDAQTLALRAAAERIEALQCEMKDGWTVKADDYDRLREAAMWLRRSCKDRLPPGHYEKVSEECRAIDAVLSPPTPARAEIVSMKTDGSTSGLALATCSVRSAFEAWITSAPMEKDITRNATDESKSAWPGQYHSYQVQLAWEAWCAALESTDCIAEYAGKDSRRDWWSGGAWLYPGDRVAIISSPNGSDHPRET